MAHCSVVAASVVTLKPYSDGDGLRNVCTKSSNKCICSVGSGDNLLGLSDARDIACSIELIAGSAILRLVGHLCDSISSLSSA